MHIAIYYYTCINMQGMSNKYIADIPRICDRSNDYKLLQVLRLLQIIATSERGESMHAVGWPNCSAGIFLGDDSTDLAIDIAIDISYYSSYRQSF